MKLNHNLDATTGLSSVDVSAYSLTRAHLSGRMLLLCLFIVLSIVTTYVLSYDLGLVSSTSLLVSKDYPCGTWQSSTGSLVDAVGLTAVASKDKNDVWIVGAKHSFFYLDNAQPLVKHWNGIEWKDISSMSYSRDRRVYLWDVYPISNNNVWVVGNSDEQAKDGKIYIANWNGNSWATYDGPNLGVRYNSILSIAAINSNDVWAVGYYEDAIFDTYPLILHWDGKTWSNYSTTNMKGFSLNSIAAFSTRDVWAVGGNNILHWDGIEWRMYSTPFSSSINTRLNAISGSDSNDIWVVGGSTIAHWDGRTWRNTPNPLNASYEGLNGVASVARDDVWAVGNSNEQQLVLHWNGNVWSKVTTPQPRKTNRLAAVAVEPQGDIWAVGLSREDKYNPTYSLVGRFSKVSCYSGTSPLAKWSWHNVISAVIPTSLCSTWWGAARPSTSGGCTS